MTDSDSLTMRVRQARERAEDLFDKIRRGEVEGSEIVLGALYDQYNELEREGPIEEGEIDDLLVSIDFVLDVWRIVDESHKKAMSILTNRRQPYVLFLRGFDLDGLALDQATEGLSEFGRFAAGDHLLKNKSIQLSFRDMEDGRVYRNLATALVQVLPVVGIRHIDTASPFGPDHLPSLFFRRGEWREKIEWLLRTAPAVVTCVTHASPGVSYEIEKLREYRRQEHTVVTIFHPRWRKEIAASEKLALLGLIQGATDTGLLMYPLLDPCNPLISDFGNVIETDDVEFGDLMKLPVWAPVTRLHISVDESVLMDRAMGLSGVGRRLCKNTDYEDALAPLNESAGLWRTLVDQNRIVHLGGLAAILNNLGWALLSLDRNEEACRFFEEALVAYRELTQAGFAVYLSGLAMSLQNIGTCLSAMGRHDEALARTSEAADTYRVIPMDVDLFERAQVLYAFARVRSVAGADLSSALDAVTESLAIYSLLAKGNPSLLGTMLARHHTFADILEGLGRNEEAAKLRQSIIELVTRITESGDISSSEESYG
jgi:tetratricopeptide (TPR) repeat protein